MANLLAPIDGTPYIGGTPPGVLLVSAAGIQQLLTLPDDPALWLDGQGNWTAPAGAGTETDPVFAAADCAAITATQIGNWDDAYGWGDHGAAGYLGDVVDDTSPQAGGNFDANGHTIHFGTTENTQTPAGTTATIDLGAENHHTLDCGSASGAITLTLTVPPGPCAGTIVVKQGATARDITWSPSAGSVKWLGTEPTWTSDTSKYRIVAWRWDAAILFLSATETD